MSQNVHRIRFAEQICDLVLQDTMTITTEVKTDAINDFFFRSRLDRKYHKHTLCIITRMTKDGICIGNCIYCTLIQLVTSRNYTAIAISHTL
jgi:hypothetical protein